MDTKELRKVIEFCRDWNAGMDTNELVSKYGYKNIGSLRGAVASYRKKGVKLVKRSKGYGLTEKDVEAINRNLD